MMLAVFAAVMWICVALCLAVGGFSYCYGDETGSYKAYACYKAMGAVTTIVLSIAIVTSVIAFFVS